MSETRNVGPIDLYPTADGANVYWANGDLIARIVGNGNIRTVINANRCQPARELGRIRRDGFGQWEASTYDDDKDDTIQLRGTHSTIETAILAILRSE